MSTPSVPNPSEVHALLACLACGDPFTLEGLAEGNLPVLFSCGHTVCVDCARNVALSLPGYDGKWACGWCKRGDGGCVNAGVIALAQSLGSEAVDSGPVLSRFYVDPDTTEEPIAPFDFSALTGEATAAITTALTDLERVNTARATMRAGFESSRTMFIAGIDSLLSSIIAHRDRVLGEAKLLFDAREKALGVQVEELSVKVSLLRQVVDVCKATVDGGVVSAPAVYESSRNTVKGLTAAPFVGLAVPPVVGIDFDAKEVEKALVTNLRFKCVVQCELSGPGLEGFIAGGASSECAQEQNAFTLVCDDGQPDTVAQAGADAQARDIVLRVWCAESGNSAGGMVSVARDVRGVFSCVYSVESVDVDAIDLEVRVYGEPVIDSPVRVYCAPKLMFEGSAVLSSVSPSIMKSFANGLRTWLRRAGPPVLLFRMSRDGTSTSTFHSLCDGKASSLTLIKSSEGFVFGGYAGAAWGSNKTWLNCSKCFIFTVTNPHGIPPTQYVVNDPVRAMYGSLNHGPYFGGTALSVGDGDGSLISQSGTPLTGYADTTGLGAATFNGATDNYGIFTPAEVEVWQMPLRE